MGDPHMLVINDIGKVVGGESIRLREDVVGLGFPLFEVAVDKVFHPGDVWRAAKADDERLPLARTLLGFRRRDTTTCARVV